MSDLQTQAPTRLLDDPNLDAGLRSDLELARSHHAVSYSVDAGLARFEQSIHVGATTVPPGGSVAGLRVLGWFVGAIVLFGGIGYLALGSVDPDGETEGNTNAVAQTGAVEREASQPIRAETAPVIGLRRSDVSAGPSGPGASESIAEMGEPDGAGEDPAKAQAKGGSPEIQVPSSPRSTSKSNTVTAPEPSLADEAAQINAARKALASGDPSEALELMEAAEQAFPKGAMIQERRGYAILALVALDRRTDADERADAYLERWPNGPLSRRVRDALGR